MIQKLRKIFNICNDVDAILISNTDRQDPNFTYITGFKSGIFEYDNLVLERSTATLFTSVLEYDTAKAQAPKHMKVICFKDVEKQRSALEKTLRGRRIGMNGMFIPFDIYKRVKNHYKPKSMKDVSDKLSLSRMIKDDEEINNIKKAASITKKAMELVRKELKEGITEQELANKFDNISASLGSTEPSFKTIVCFGENAAFPHHSPDNRKLKRGDVVLIDAGAKFNSYCSDITRTIIWDSSKNKISEEMARIIEVVREAHDKSISAIKPGVEASNIHKIAQEHIDNAYGGRYKGRFIHALGHSVGIEVHDGPGFSPGISMSLKPGMVITVEPGIYIPGIGGARIEDDVLVTKTGSVIL